MSNPILAVEAGCAECHTGGPLIDAHLFPTMAEAQAHYADKGWLQSGPDQTVSWKDHPAGGLHVVVGQGSVWLTEYAPPSQRWSGDRRLPPPYDGLGAADREVWLVCEGIYDGALTADVRRANGDRPMTAWQDLTPEAHQALVPILTQMVPILHAVALNAEARRG